MNDLERLQKLQSLLGEIDRLLDPDFCDRMDARIDEIAWMGNYGNRMKFLIQAVSYWDAELNTLEQDLKDYPEDIV
jgi:hypothetical protein